MGAGFSYPGGILYNIREARMAKVTPSPGIIIDLTEIVEPGKATADKAGKSGADDMLGAHASDLMGNSTGDDVELDDLLAQLNDGEPVPGGARAVNPDESLNMPGMDDMDALFGSIDKTASPSAPTPAPDTETDLDALLAGIDTPKPKAAPAARADDLGGLGGLDGPDGLDGLLDGLMNDPPKAAPKPDTGADDLDGLLDGLLDSASTSKQAPIKEQDLDALLDDLDAGLKESKSAATGGAVSNDDLDALLAQLDGPATPPTSGATSGAASPKAAQARATSAEDALSNLLDTLDVPPSGPVGRDAPAESACVSHDMVDALGAPNGASAPDSPDSRDARDAMDSVDEASLDALLSGGHANTALSSDVQGMHEELAAVRDEVRQTAEAVQTLLGEHGALRQAVLELQEARGVAPDMLGALTGRLDVLEVMAAPLAEMDSMKARLDACEALTTRCEEIDELKARLDACDALHARMDAVESHLAAISDTLDQLTPVETAAHDADLLERMQKLESGLADAVNTAETTAATLQSRFEELGQTQASELEEMRSAGETRMTDAVEQVRVELAERLAEQLADITAAQSSAELPEIPPVAPDIPAIAAQVLEQLRPEIERAAASAAAQIIREEISALLAAEEE